MENTLDADERQRYKRHLENLPGFTEDSQRSLKAARVLVVGLGGLGGPTAFYLTAAGVGTIGLADPDVIELSNLQRQILHRTEDIGRPKTVSAVKTLRALNPHVNFEEHPEGLTAQNGVALCRSYDIIIDCSDNFPTRFLANDAAFFAKRPLVHAGVSCYETQLMLVDSAQGTPCLRCLCPTIPATPSKTPGVLSPAPGVAGSLQALTAIKHLAGLGPSQAGKLFHLDSLTMRSRLLALTRNSDCPLCGTSPTIKGLCPDVYRRS